VLRSPTQHPRSSWPPQWLCACASRATMPSPTHTSSSGHSPVRSMILPLIRHPWCSSAQRSAQALETTGRVLASPLRRPAGARRRPRTRGGRRCSES
jgi:hypothetical protein